MKFVKKIPLKLETHKSSLQHKVLLFQTKRETSSRVTIYTSEVSERACSSSSLSSSLSLSFSKIIILRRQMHIKPHLIASLERLGTSNLFSLS